MSGPDPRHAALTEARDHLLRSLDDLEEEHDAGDLDDDDYRALKADYTTRAAEAIRALEADATVRRPSGEPGVSRSPARTAAWVVGIGVVALFAGVLLARFSGSRGAGDSITGDIRETVREQLFEAQQLAATGDREGAITVYDAILEQEPANAEALTWKGWFTNLDGDPATARVLLDDAVASDRELPEARVFAASLDLAAGDPAGAAEHLAVLDTLPVAPEIERLVAGFALRERTAALLGDPVALIDRAEALFLGGEALEAVMLLDEVLAERPTDVELLAARGWVYGRIDDEELRRAGLASLDEALTLSPSHAPSLVFRAIVRTGLGDLDGARADLAAFDALAEQAPDLLAWIDAVDLRSVLDAGG